MNPIHFQLWMSVWNYGIKSGLPAAQALANADKAVAALKG